MFEWLFKKLVKKCEELEEQEEKVEENKLLEVVKLALDGKCISDKQIFEEFVRKTYSAHSSSLFQYDVRCARLGLPPTRMLRISSADDYVVFLNPETEEIYYLECRDSVPYNGTEIEDRDFACVYEFSELLETYINTIHCEDKSLRAIYDSMNSKES